MYVYTYSQGRGEHCACVWDPGDGQRDRDTPWEVPVLRVFLAYQKHRVVVKNFIFMYLEIRCISAAFDLADSWPCILLKLLNWYKCSKVNCTYLLPVWGWRQDWWNVCHGSPCSGSQAWAHPCVELGNSAPQNCPLCTEQTQPAEPIPGSVCSWMQPCWAQLSLLSALLGLHHLMITFTLQDREIFASQYFGILTCEPQRSHRSDLSE